MNDFLVLQKEYFMHFLVYFMILEKEYVVQILHILQLNLVVYLVVLEVDYFVHYLHFLCMYLVLYLVQQHMVLILFYVFLEDEATLSPIPASDGAPYPTVLTSDPIPNDIFKK